MQELAIPSELADKPPTFLVWARSLTIATPAEYTAAAEQLQSIKGFAKRVSAWFKPMKQAQDEAKKRILDAEHSLLDPSAEAEKLAKAALEDFTKREQAKAEAERKRLQSIADERARKEREIAEQAAARQRAIEAEQRAKVEAARIAEEKARREAEAANAAERKRLLAEAEASRKEAEKAERAAAAAAVKVEAAEDKAALVEAPVIAVAAPVPKVAGITTRRSWKAEIVDLAVFCAAVIEYRRSDLILPNMDVLTALAKGLGERAEFPGVKFFQAETMGSRSK